MEPIITVRDLGKCYTISHQGVKTRNDTLRDEMSGWFKNLTRKRTTEEKSSKEEFWALKDVSFDVNPGDRLGIIGRNGAGKSTLLKILSRITEPTTGEIRIKGRVASLLEVGTGFHPELTGRENIYLNGAILGMSRVEIKKKFDEIVAFSEVEKFLDTPVKRYSSGMYVRLAFAVAAHLEPEILIIDEVLSVGDAQFQKKSMGKMEDVSKAGRTVIFVSHNMVAVKTLCNKGIMLKDGKKYYDGNISECINSYLEPYIIQPKCDNLLNVKRVIKSEFEAKIVSFLMFDEETGSINLLSLRPVIVEMDIEVFCDEISVGCEFIITDGMQKLALLNSNFQNGLTPILKRGQHKFQCKIDKLSLVSGTYFITLAILKPGKPCIDYIENAYKFDVQLPLTEGGMQEYNKVNGCFYINHSWCLKA
jgi:lipopolysaccharide transport system ATP-binding protein